MESGRGGGGHCWDLEVCPPVMGSGEGGGAVSVRQGWAVGAWPWSHSREAWEALSGGQALGLGRDKPMVTALPPVDACGGQPRRTQPVPAPPRPGSPWGRAATHSEEMPITARASDKLWSPGSKVGQARPGGTITFQEAANFLPRPPGGRNRKRAGGGVWGGSCVLKIQQAGGDAGKFQTGKSQRGILLGSHLGAGEGDR